VGRWDDGTATGAEGGALNPVTGDSDVIEWPFVERYSPDGQLLAKWAAPGGNDSYSDTEGIAAGPDGTVYVTDAGCTRISAPCIRSTRLCRPSSTAFARS